MIKKDLWEKINAYASDTKLYSTSKSKAYGKFSIYTKPRKEKKKPKKYSLTLNWIFIFWYFMLINFSPLNTTKKKIYIKKIEKWKPGLKAVIS